MKIFDVFVLMSYTGVIQNPFKDLRRNVLRKMVNGLKPLAVFPKRSSSDIWQGSGYASVLVNLIWDLVNFIWKSL